MAEKPKYYKIHTDGCTVELEPIYDDLQPVVRCKDCKWFAPNNDGLWDECIHDIRVSTPNKNDFCSYGERRVDT